MLDALNRRPRYAFSKHPHLLARKHFNREQIHPPATTFSELTKDNQEGFMTRALQIWNKAPECRLYAFGSRVAGNFLRESDYDINVIGTTTHQQKAIKKIQFEKTDLKFNPSTPKWKNSIQILPPAKKSR